MRTPLVALLAALILAPDPTAAASAAAPPYAPSLPPAAGYRADGDRLLIWTGTPCHGITRITLRLDSGSRASVFTVLEAERPAMVERFGLDAPPPGFRVMRAFPPGTDWRKARTVSLNLDGGDSRWSSVMRVADVITGSSRQDRRAYLFDRLGWYDAADVKARNGKTFLTLCTPDPADPS